MDKTLNDLTDRYRNARRDYLQAKIRLLEHLLKRRRARRARADRPIELPGYDRS